MMMRVEISKEKYIIFGFVYRPLHVCLDSYASLSLHRVICVYYGYFLSLIKDEVDTVNMIAIAPTSLRVLFLFFTY